MRTYSGTASAGQTRRSCAELFIINLRYIMEKYDYTSNDFKELLKAKLNENEVGITFTKRDGSERRMLCTLSTSRIPGEHIPQGKGDTSTAKTFSEEALRVFDTEKVAWRSFRFDSIKSVTF